MDSFEMPAPGAKDISFRFVKLMPSELEVGECVVVGAYRVMLDNSQPISMFPLKLQYRIASGEWHDVAVTP